MNKNIVVYSQPGCAACKKVKEYLVEKSVQFTEKDISRDRSALNEVRTMGVMTIPLTIIDGESITGYDQDRLDQLLSK